MIVPIFLSRSGTHARSIYPNIVQYFCMCNNVNARATPFMPSFGKRDVFDLLKHKVTLHGYMIIP
jgi:hypothetical protein